MKTSMFMIPVTLLLALCLLLPAHASAAAGLFKWTDKDGVVHFSDQPHNDPKAERITKPRTSAPGAPPPPPAREEPPAEQTAVADAQAKHQQQIRSANCDIARRTLEHNESIHRMYRLDEHGERVFLTDEERADLLKRSRDDVARWCD